MPSIRVEEFKERGNLLLVVEGDPSQGQPWRIELSPDSAYSVGNNLALLALKVGAGRGSPCFTLAGDRVGNPQMAQRPRPFLAEAGPVFVGDTFEESSKPLTTAEVMTPSNLESPPEQPRADSKE